MAILADSMPPLVVSNEELRHWGELWRSDYNPEKERAKHPDAFDRQQSVNFASFIDRSFAQSLSVMLGNIQVIVNTNDSLVAPQIDCVEVGKIRIIGGIRPQNFDAAYRPDGPRVVFDSKTLNDASSVRKNWQNMINDLSTEAATVHTRFPYAVVCFAVVIPRPALAPKQEADIIRTLERLGSRKDVLDQSHLAEAITLIVWDPDTGTIDPNAPAVTSNIHIDRYSSTIHPHYLQRYKGLPPHNVAEEPEEE